MSKVLVAGAILWPLLLGATLWRHAAHDAPWWTMGVDAVASAICHRLPDRSFHTAGAQWPVCARCSGLYLAAPIGALAAVTAAGRRRVGEARRLRWTLAIAALPTSVTLGLEWLHLAAPSNLVRAAAALPLGAALAFAIVRVTQNDRVH